MYKKQRERHGTSFSSSCIAKVQIPHLNIALLHFPLSPTARLFSCAIYKWIGPLMVSAVGEWKVLYSHFRQHSFE